MANYLSFGSGASKGPIQEGFCLKKYSFQEFFWRVSKPEKKLWNAFCFNC
jgi:hypothetical protein